MPRKRRSGPQIKGVTVSTRITEPTLENLNKYLIKNAHVSLADYLRDLIRIDLQSKGYRLYAEGPQAEKGAEHP